MVAMYRRGHSKEGLKQPSRAAPTAPPSSHRPLTPAQRSNFWWFTAVGYHTWRARSLRLLSGHPLTLDREAALFTALARPAPGERWLDAGTSSGFYAGVLARAGARVIAADLSPAMLAEAARRGPPEGVELALLDVTDTGLPTASLDGITVGATLGELHDPAAGLREFERLLRPGGRLWLMYVLRSGGEMQGALERFGGLTFPDAADIAGTLAGCDRVHTVRFGVVAFDLFVRKPEV